MNRPFDIPDNRHSDALRFPVEQSRVLSDHWRYLTGQRLSDDRHLEALARRFNCLGHFGDPNGPRAA